MSFKRVSLIICLSLFFSACQKEVELPEPILLKDKKHRIEVDIDNNVFQKFIKIESNTGNLESEKVLIQEALSFLVKTFKKPIVKKKVLVKISKEHIPYPKMTINKKTNQRTVLFSSFYMYKSELPTIVHELFHALYQSDNLIESHSDFILEGMAIYVESYFKYGSIDETKKALENDIEESKVCQKIGAEFPIDSKFYNHSSSIKYNLYILGGNFFALQKNNAIDFIKKMIEENSKKQSLRSFIKHHKLDYTPCGLIDNETEQFSFKIDKNLDKGATNATVLDDNTLLKKRR